MANAKESKKKDNIILIGMPGVGKSTVGVIMAKILGYTFIDTDLVIQDKYGKKLSELIDENGPEGFLELENRVCSELPVSHAVVATGGSVVYGEDAMAHLSEAGVVVYIQQNIWHLKRRLHNIRGRGVVLKDGQTFDDLYEEREDLYRKYADVIVDEHGLSVEETIRAVIQSVHPYLIDCDPPELENIEFPNDKKDKTN